MRTLFLALATSAIVFASGVTEVAAGDYHYCIQGDDFPGGAGDCSFAKLPAMPSHRVRPHGLLRSQSSFPECRPNRSDSPASSLMGVGPSKLGGSEARPDHAQADRL